MKEQSQLTDSVVFKTSIVVMFFLFFSASDGQANHHGLQWLTTPATWQLITHGYRLQATDVFNAKNETSNYKTYHS